MVNVRIRGQDVDIDLEAELSNFEWTRPSWRAGKFQAASPFRYDRTPSFFVSLDGEYAGCWGDSGHYDAEWASGNFAKLLAFLRNESYEEAEEYLLESYGIPAEAGAQLTLKLPKLQLAQRTRQTLAEDTLSPYSPEPSEYLRLRGIPDEVQRVAGVHFSEINRAIVLPWRTKAGKLANVKYRKTYGKTFWYAKGAEPIRNLVYGIGQAERTTVLCEAEIDALSWRTAGYAAVAVGGVAFNRTKRDLIIRSPVEELIIATDNDKAGEKLRREVEKEMRGYVRTRQAYIGKCLPDGGFSVKDANEALVKYGVDALRESAEKSESCGGLYVNLRTRSRGK
ncbi:toprim domain-containing protein [Peribacillus butanolivorans]|uniref:Toprim domain-containing protein n=1 Tax=Peribacillus butanolivorans TaxID=421767 RepID=A0ABM6XMR6_9BACI|nr:toprim domain-containing protein [Peribacillus butanolivorans]AXN39812.1 toprim domain-containing protein [Peribacillus butanolivorans]